MNKTTTIKSVAVITVFCVAAFALFKSPAQQESDSAIDNSTNTSETQANSAQQPTSTYKNGSYTVTGNYISPAGPESINVSLTLENDVVTDATVVAAAINPVSVKMQTAFIGGYKDLVVGKKIDEVQLDKVSGSSLTPKGFNDALVKIKAQAQS